MNTKSTDIHIPTASERSKELTRQVIEYQKLPAGNKKQVVFEQILSENERLIYEVIKHYKGKLEREDLLQEARIGFYMAMETFDATQQTNFSTYCVRGMQIAIYKMIERQENAIRLPSQMYSKTKKINNLFLVLEQKLQRKPTLQEVSEVSGLSIREIEQILKIPTVKISLDEPVDDSDDFRIQDTVEDENALLMLEKIEQEDEKNRLLSAIFEKLNDREKIILWQHLGERKTLDDLANVFQVSRERIRQIESKALKKVRK